MRVRKYSRRRYRRKRPRRYRSKSRRGYRKYRRYRRRKMSTRSLVRYTLRTRPKPELKHLFMRFHNLNNSRLPCGEFESNSQFEYDQFLDIESGVRQFERIGTKIKLKSLIIRGSIYNTGYLTSDATHTHPPFYTPVTVMLMWIPHIYNQGTTPSQITPTNVFKEPNVASFSRLVMKRDDEFVHNYKILYKKKVNLRQPATFFKLEGATPVLVGATTTSERWVHDFKLKFKFNKVITYDSQQTAVDYPRGRFVLWIGCDSDDSEQQFGSSSVQLQYLDYDVFWYDN